MPQPILSETSLIELLTSKDPDLAMRGRLVATGVLDTLKEWSLAERSRGVSPVDITRNAIVVIVGEIGILLASTLRDDTPPELIRRTVRMYAETAAGILQCAFETEAEYRAE